ncbi:hypothetical protein NPIL_354361 [Nephila pilipes]|uniref:Uncharacterized protein n=1 Tax=Nephila pilipes TaxID=299642 RepID=A0A8X6NJC3_NEPPI|nr:hypothetical protein NPIL_354361 [Nephila pilipes]
MDPRTFNSNDWVCLVSRTYAWRRWRNIDVEKRFGRSYGITGCAPGSSGGSKIFGTESGDLEGLIAGGSGSKESGICRSPNPQVGLQSGSGFD